MKLRHYFLPHPETHEKPHLLHWHFLVIYSLLFILLQVSFQLYSFYKPGVLGVNSQITAEQVIEFTNQQRQKQGLGPLKPNSMLANAAAAKAQNMFEENYWAHYSPSGKDPWGFITRSGYKFSYAGENLARNFQTSEDVVKAWMNSPSHKENILNPNYQEIGIAVVDGVLLGQKTTLVVQEFGRPYEAVADVPKIDLGGAKITLSERQLISKEPPLVAGFATTPVPKALLNPYLVVKVLGLVAVGLIGLLVLLDFLVLKKRGVARASSHPFAHLSFLAAAGVAVILIQTGSIL